MSRRLSVVQVVRGFANEFSAARLNVRVAYAQPKGKWSYRRLGFAFDKEPTELELSQLGTDPVQVASSIVRLATDKQTNNETGTLDVRLDVTLAVPDLPDRAIDEADIAELRAFVAARGVVAE